MRRSYFLLLLIFMLSLSACGPSTEEILEYVSQTQTAAAPISTCGPSVDELLGYISQTQTAAAPAPVSTPDGYVEIPDVIGMTRGEANELLEGLGLAPRTFWVLHADYSYGQVTDCEPGVGEIVPLESEVVLDVVGEVVNDGGNGGGEPGCGPEPDPSTCSPAHHDWCDCMGYFMYVCSTISGGSCSP